MAGTPQGLDAHDISLEKTVAIALTHMTKKMLSKEGSIYIKENSVTPTRSSATDILSLMDLHGKTWILDELPESLAFLKTTATSPNPLIPKIAILGLQKLHAELNRVEGVRKAEDFLTAFYKKTMQVNDPWVSFSVEDETFKLSLLDIFCITALAVEDLSSPRTESEAASSTALVASSTAVEANFWEAWTRYLFSDVGITTACSARYRDLMMISLRSLGHPDARSIFPGMGPIIHEAMTECIQNLRPSFGLDYAQKLYNRLLDNAGSSWIQILSDQPKVSHGYTSFALQNFGKDDFEELQELLSGDTSIDSDALDRETFEKVKDKIISTAAESTQSTAAPSSAEAYTELSFTMDEVNALKFFLDQRYKKELSAKLLYTRNFPLQNFNQVDFEALGSLLSGVTSIHSDDFDDETFARVKSKITSSAALPSTGAYKQLSFTMDEVNALNFFLDQRYEEELSAKLPYTIYNFFGDLSKGSHFAFRRYFIDCFFPEFLIKAQLDLRKMKDSSFPSKLKAQLAADFPNTADPQHYSLLESQRWTFSPENPGYFLESLAGEIATDAPCLKVLLRELETLNKEQRDTHDHNLELGLSKIDECAKQLLLIVQQRKKIKANGYDNPSNRVAFDEKAKAFIQKTDLLFLNTDGSKSITTLTRLNNHLSESKESQEAIENFLSEEASFSHAAITSVFSLLFDTTQSLKDRLRYLHQVVLIQPSPVNETWLLKFLENRECFAKEVNRLVLYALTNELNTWTPTLASCLKRLLETFSKMESLQTYVESLGLDITALDTDKKKELENQIKFKQDSYPTYFVELLSQLLKTYETRHPIASESAALAMTEADPIASAPTVEDYPPVLGLYELYFKLCDDIGKIAKSLTLLELSPDFVCDFVLSHLGKIQNGFQLAKVITALGGKEISLVNATRLLTPACLEKIQNGSHLVDVIEALGGKEISDENAKLLLTKAVLGKIQNSFQVAEVIKALGGKDFLTEHQGLLLTEAVLGKIQDGFQLVDVIKALGGPEISPRNAALLFTPAFLEKIQDGFQLAQVMKALGGKEISLRNTELLFTPAVLGKIQDGNQLAEVIKALGGPEILPGNPTQPLTEAFLGKIQNHIELFLVINTLGSKEILAGNADRLLTTAFLEKIQDGDQLARVIKALGGKDLSAQNRERLLTSTIEKIQGGYQLSWVIESLGGKEISDENAKLLLTEAVLGKIEDGNQLARVIGSLGGKEISDENAKLLLTEAVLGKIEDGYQLAGVIKALGGKDLSAPNGELFLTEEVLEKIQHGYQLALVIGSLGGKEISDENAKLLLTSTIEKIQDGNQLASVIQALGGKQINQSHFVQLVKMLLPEAMRLVDSMVSFGTTSLENFIPKFNSLTLSAPLKLDFRRSFIDAATNAQLYGPERVAESHDPRSSLAILTTALIKTGIPDPIGHPPEN